MASKFITFLGLLALSGSGMAGVATYVHNPFFKSFATSPLVAAPVVRTVSAPTAFVNSAPVVAATPAALVKTEQIDSHPQYDFSYGVHDSITGDIKNQVESRDGNNVVGSYSTVDADGFKRTVTYTADNVNGFNAVVNREPIAAAKVVVATAAPAAIVHAAPVIKTYAAAAPVVHAAPVIQAAPVIKTYAATAPFFHSTPVVKSYTAAPLIHAAPVVKSYTSAPLLHSAQSVNTYAAAPLIHSARFYKSYAAAPVVQSSPFYTAYATSPAIHSAPVFKSYASAPVVHSTPFFQSTPVFPQYHQFSSPPQQFTYINYPTSAAELPHHHQVITDVQTEQQPQQASEQPQQDPEQPQQDPEQPQQAPEQPQQDPEQPQQDPKQPQQDPEQPENDSTPIEHPELQEEQQQQNPQQLFQHQFVQQQQFLAQQSFPPYPQYGIPQQQFQIGQQQHPQNNEEADVVEARLVATKERQPQVESLGSKQGSQGISENKAEAESSSLTRVSTATVAPALVTEDQNKSTEDKKKKSP